MARRKFPDDDRNWFRCLTDILYDEKLNGDCPPEVAWFYMRLLALLKQTGSQDGSISLDHRALGFCACRAQHRHSLSIARAGAVRGLYTLSAVGVHSESTPSALGVHSLITVHNWPKIQGIEIAREEKEESRGEENTPAPEAREKSPREPCETWALALADFLHQRLQGVPGASFSRGWRNRWAKEIERMPREIPELREMTPEERSARIEFAIEWALGPENLDQEYEVVIRCGKSLREKWPKLVAAAQRKTRGTRRVEDFDSAAKKMFAADAEF